MPSLRVQAGRGPVQQQKVGTVDQAPGEQLVDPGADLTSRDAEVAAVDEEVVADVELAVGRCPLVGRPRARALGPRKPKASPRWTSTSMPLTAQTLVLFGARQAGRSARGRCADQAVRRVRRLASAVGEVQRRGVRRGSSREHHGRGGRSARPALVVRGRARRHRVMIEEPIVGCQAARMRSRNDSSARDIGTEAGPAHGAVDL